MRQGERHLHTDPPTAAEQRELHDDVAALFARRRPEGAAERVIAVAGTPTSLAAMDMALDRYDPERVHGHVMSAARCRELLDRLAALPLAERREVTGLHPDRAPTIVAGILILLAALETFGLDELEVSEHGILTGLALALAAPP